MESIDRAQILRRQRDAAVTRSGVTLSAEDLRHDRSIPSTIHRGGRVAAVPEYWLATAKLLSDLPSASDRHGWIRPSGQLPRLRRRVPAFLKGLQARDQTLIPVVGDLSGPSAIAAIGKLLGERRIEVSAFYVSNGPEFYLFGEGAFPRYITNLGRLPHAGNSVIIRSVFGGFAGGYRPGDSSVSRLYLSTSC